MLDGKIVITREGALVRLLLQSAVAFSLAYAAIASFLYPSNWIGWFPAWTFAAAPFVPQTVLKIFSFGELCLAAALFVRPLSQYAALASGLLLLGIVVFNWGAMDIVFRDISLALAAFALAFSYNTYRT